ncbi:hypothetical protein LCGC14_2606690 [marine sediment metagenome]|uniref:Uncharacterized protein n=1 Tax=marine sediment metagenome TaxID=412755 RepID=A0A0F9A720_9ZZZZ
MTEIAQDGRVELVNSYHIAMTAIQGLNHVPTRYERMLWAANKYAREHDVKSVQAYKALSEALA